MIFLISVILQFSHGYVLEKNERSIPLHWKSKCIFLTTVESEGVFLQDVAKNLVEHWMAQIKEISSLNIILEDVVVPSEIIDEVGENTIIMVTEDWPFGVDVDAMTILTHVDEEGSELDGLLIDADVYVNDTYGRFSLSSDSSGLFTVLNHEIGHIIGLDHPCKLTPDDDPSLVGCLDSELPEVVSGSIMYPFSGSENNDMNSDDLDGISYLFPPDDQRPCSRYSSIGSEGCSCFSAAKKRNPEIKSIVIFCLVIIVLRKRLITFSSKSS
ncbi:MAG: hypothetical protein JXR95_01045 [Deltaproteobacteria bacterium]|nr:hypothetical protein [Deltaproteobacteria bacterium]